MKEKVLNPLKVIGITVPAVLLGVILLFSCIRIIPEGHIGVKYQLGAIVRSDLSAGAHLKAPFFQTIKSVDVREQVYETTTSAYTRDTQTVESIQVKLNYVYDSSQLSNIIRTIGIDNVESIGMAINHLRALGHSKIGYLSSALEAYIYQQRYKAFIQIMTDHGLTADDSVMGNHYHVNACLSQHLPRLLKNSCTAIICSHDMLAHSAMFYCGELGLSVPDDISIVGHDDIPICRYTTPPMTTVRQNRSALGKSAFYALSCQLNDVPLSTHLLHAELIIRSSCGPVPKNPKKPNFTNVFLHL